MVDEGLSPPEEGTTDLVLGLVKAGISAIPGVGGLVVELMNILGYPVERRRLEWLTTLGEDVSRLKEQVTGLTDQKLSENAAFISAVLQATQIAGRTHQEEKLEALRNAVLNVAAGSAPEDDMQAMFLDAVDNLTVSHISVLRELVNQNERARQEGIHHRAEALRPPGVKDDMLAQIIRDLRNRGIVEVDTALDQLDAGTLGGTHLRLTEYGSEFLSFITSPLADNGSDEPPAVHAPTDSRAPNC